MTGPRRGDVVTIADRGAGDYAGKPRPAVIVQSDLLPGTGSVLICPFTSHSPNAPIIRPRVEPSGTLALRAPSWIMVDKTTAVARERIGPVIGRISRAEQAELDRALLVMFGLA